MLPSMALLGAALTFYHLQHQLSFEIFHQSSSVGLCAAEYFWTVNPMML